LLLATSIGSLSFSSRRLPSSLKNTSLQNQISNQTLYPYSSNTVIEKNRGTNSPFTFFLPSLDNIWRWYLILLLGSKHLYDMTTWDAIGFI
jgi:uncharacterized protein YozE (UPF0346 family)